MYWFDQTSRISQKIIASDGGNRSSSVDLTVIITNMHNQPPQWEHAEYWVTIPENTFRDTKIVVSLTQPLSQCKKILSKNRKFDSVELISCFVWNQAHKYWNKAFDHISVKQNKAYTNYKHNKSIELSPRLFWLFSNF